MNKSAKTILGFGMFSLMFLIIIVSMIFIITPIKAEELEEILLETPINYQTNNIDLGNGKFAQTSYLGFENYKDGNEFKEIDMTLSDYGSYWKIFGSIYYPTIPKYSDEWFIFNNVYEGNNHSIRTKPITNKVLGVLNTTDNTVLYKDAFGDDMDLEIYIYNSHLLKQIVINKPQTEDLYFDFELEIDEKLDYKSVNTEKLKSNIILNESLKEKGIEFEEGKTPTIIYPMKVWDSNYSIEYIESKIYEENGKLYLRKIVSKEFLEKAVYPVYTDDDTGVTNPGTVVDDNAVGTLAWTDFTNAMVSDNNDAYVLEVGTPKTTHYLKATNFGFSITGVIDGIFVEIEKGLDGSYACDDSEVKIVKADASIGSENLVDLNAWTFTDNYVGYGNSTYLWGESWSDTNINDVDFGVVLSATRPSGEGLDCRVDHIRMTVYYTTNTAPTNPIPILNSTDSAQTNYTDEDLQSTFDCDDDDTGDTMTYDINWLKNNISQLTFSDVSCVEDSQAIAILKSGNTTRGDLWSSEVRIYDQTDYSNWVNSTQLTIEDTPPIWAEAITNQSLSEDFATTTVDSDLTASGNGQCTDADSDSLTFSITSENTSEVDYTISTNQLNIDSAANYSGTAFGTIRCTGNSLTVDFEHQTIVSQVNDAPNKVGDLENITTIENFGNIIAIINADLKANWTDVEDSEPTTYEIVKQTNTSTSCNFDNNNHFNCSSLTNQVGVDLYTISLNDSGGLSVEYDWNITVNDITNPLLTIISPTNNTQFGLGTTSTTLNINVTDTIGIDTCELSFPTGNSRNTTVTSGEFTSFTVSSLVNCNQYTYSYSCNDTVNNVNNSGNLFLSVACPAPTEGGSSGGGTPIIEEPLVVLPVNVTEPILNIVDEVIEFTNETITVPINTFIMDKTKIKIPGIFTNPLFTIIILFIVVTLLIIGIMKNQNLSIMTSMAMNRNNRKIEDKIKDVKE